MTFIRQRMEEPHMTQADIVLQTLLENDGAVSGQWISEQLGVTRAAVWKYVKELQDRGYPIEATPRTGYRITALPDWLDEPLLRHALRQQGYTGSWGGILDTHDTLPSTNQRARELAINGAAEGTIVLADAQTLGRGRMNRVWDSRPGMGLWMSIILRPTAPPHRTPGITLVTALALHRVLADMYMPVGIKWPNDLLLGDGRKVCGILTEMSCDMDRVHWLVVGIGLNVHHTQDDFPEELRGQAGSLAELGFQGTRASILAALMMRLELLYRIYLTDGLTTLLPAYRNASVTIGKTVQVTDSSLPIDPITAIPAMRSGLAKAVDNEGALLLETANGEVVRVVCGDIRG